MGLQMNARDIVVSSLFDTLPAQHEISLEPIPDAIALRPLLVKIVVFRTNPATGEVTRFALPVQWEEREAAELIHQLRGVSWQLGEDGIPIDFESIIEICDQYLYQKMGFIEPISYKWKPKNGNQSQNLEAR